MFVSGRLPQWYPLRRSWLGVGIVAAALFSGPEIQAKEGNPASHGVVSLNQLPPEGRSVYQLIQSGGPFAHRQDGATFGNRERRLPARSRGFYREYTVVQPGARDRGPQRIVCGGPPRLPEACYYTADHYSTFRRITP